MLKIINQTDSEILIAPKISFRDKLPFSKFLLCFALPFLSLPLLFVFDYTSKTGVVKIECDRVEPQQVDCQISKSQFFDLVKNKPLDYKFVQLSKYEAVRNQGLRINDEPAFVTRFVLTTKFGDKEVFENVHERTASNISNSLNSLLGSNQKYFSYIYDERFIIYYPVSWGAWGVLFLVVICFVIWFFISWVAFAHLIDKGEEILINKSEATLKHTKTNFLGIRKVNHYFFAVIAKVDVVYETDSYDKVSFVPRIILHFGEQFRLDKFSDRQAAIKVANDLNRFIGLPEEEDPVVKE